MHPILIGIVVWLAVIGLVVLLARILLPHRRTVVVCPQKKQPAVLDLDGHLAVEACTCLSAEESCAFDCLVQVSSAPTKVEPPLARQVLDC